MVTLSNRVILMCVLDVGDGVGDVVEGDVNGMSMAIMMIPMDDNYDTDFQGHDGDTYGGNDGCCLGWR
eukprot:12929895-Prorocentrum_lima.AAC.1